jgi:NadR type nicotinamide-nucleotide adenylyltransferase
MEENNEKADLKKHPKIIVITGAESTGKSVLTERLSNYFKVPFIPEFAREYIENLDRNYNYLDVEKIAKKQISQLEALKQSAHQYVFVDTWLIITKIWFDVVFGKIPSWLESSIQKTKIDLFLVCDTNLPWEPDPVRENGGEQREILQARYINELENYNFNYQIISGKGEKRFRAAFEEVKKLNFTNR